MTDVKIDSPKMTVQCEIAGQRKCSVNRDGITIKCAVFVVIVKHTL